MGQQIRGKTYGQYFVSLFDTKHLILIVLIVSALPTIKIDLLMRRLSLLIPLAGCILSFVSERVLAAPTPYSTMIVFGDSLSDSGHFPDTGSGMRFTNRSGPTYRGEAYSAVAPMILGAKLSIAPGDLSPSTSPGNAFTGDPDGNNWAVGGYRNVNIGTSYRLDEHWRLGVASGFDRQRLETGAHESDYKLNSYLGSVFAQYQHNHWWGDAALTLGRLDYDSLNRKFALGVSEGVEKGQADGHLRALSTRLGYDIAQASASWHLSPFISADYSRVEVNRYEEKGRRSTALNYEEQTLVSNRLGAGVLASYQFTPQTRVFGEAVHEHEFQNATQRLSIALNSLPNNSFTLEGYTPQSNLDRISLGISHRLTADLMLQAAYNVRKGDGVVQQGANLGVSLNF